MSRHNKVTRLGTADGEAWREDVVDLLMQSPDLVALYDGDDRLQAANPAYRDAYHCDPAEHLCWREIMRVNFEHKRGPIIETGDIDGWLTIAMARRGTVPYRSFEAGLYGRGWIWITETVCPEGRMLFRATDISGLRTEGRMLRLERDAARRESWTDALTGVPNRRYLMARLEEWHQKQCAHPDLGTHCLAVVDLDHFKQVNDRYGHSCGDAVLISFCRDVVGGIRSQDLFGRIGGEEFLVLMPNCPLEVARERLGSLQQKLDQSGPIADHPSFRYSFSAGLVRIDPDEDIHNAIRRADKCLYDAKAAGRARVNE
ncbi:GGDEF domain-containing protein [Frigidibacter sp.]|uniref:GGDEF domain-containing protein n=1 Tax=Frigidibacter sp. TaxID=2586418 RepID=UPI002735A076|nr:GGDEF domain-containing protein [Frigidibacter sp.]MDP3342281.1 GGDEF domain-containing protein [Frigidibacter sp.]